MNSNIVKAVLTRLVFNIFFLLLALYSVGVVVNYNIFMNCYIIQSFAALSVFICIHTIYSECMFTGCCKTGARQLKSLAGRTVVFTRYYCL